MTRLRNSFKITLACLLSFIVEQCVNLPFGQLIVISTLLVMIGNEDYGSTLKKSYIRLLGAFAGGMIALLTLMLWGLNLYFDYLVFSIEIFGFALLINGFKKIQSGGIFGALTLISILLSKNPDTQTVYISLCQILLGIVIALCISRWVFPVHTKTSLKKLLSSSLLQLSELYRLKFCGAVHPYYLENPYQYETKILRSFGDHERLLIGSDMNRLDKKLIVTLYKKIILCERGIFRSSLFLSRVTQLNQQYAIEIHRAASVESFHKIAAQLIEQLGKRLSLQQVPFDVHLESALANLTTELMSQVQESTPQQRVYLYTYIGSCQYLCHELNALIILLLRELPMIAV